MTSGLIRFLQRHAGWRLWSVFALATVAAAELIVTLMDLLQKGEVTSDYLLTGLVAAGIVAPVSLFLMSSLLEELARQQHQILANSLESTEARLKIALDSSDEGILMVGADGRVLSVNKRFFELWRVPARIAATEDDSLLLSFVLDQLLDPSEFIAGVQELYGSDAEATDTLRFKDGRVFERFTRALSLGQERGRIWCFRDVSEQARTRAELAEREQLYSAILSQAGDGIDLVDVETLRFVEVNDTACRMLGYQRHELIDQPLAKIQADLDEVGLRQAATRIGQTGQARFEARHRCKDGRILDVQLNVKLIRLHERDCLVAIWRDVTESKAVVEALKTREEIYSAIVNRSVEGILLVDAETMEFREFNDAACEGLGYTREEFSRLKLSDVQGGMTADETLAKCRVAADTPDGLNFENRHRCKDGSLRDRHVSNRPVQIRGRTYLAHVWHDVTEHKLAEAALAESRNLLQAVIDTAPMRVFWKDRNLRYMGCNPAFARDAGKSGPAELVGRDDYQMGWAEQADLYRADDRAVMVSGVSRLSYEEPQTTPDGGAIWLSTSKVPLRNENGETIGVLGIYQDVTERKRTEEALRISEQRYRSLFENMQPGFALHQIVTDAAGKPVDYIFLATNEAFGRVTGFDAAGIIGKRVTEVVPNIRADRTDWIGVYGRVALEGASTHFESYSEALHRWYDLIAYQPAPGQFAVLVSDITERKRLEQRLELAIDVSQVILWELDFRNGHLSFDAAMLPILGLDAEDAPDSIEKWIACIHQDDRRPFKERLELALQPGDSLFSFEYRVINKAGEQQWLHSKGRVVRRGADGHPVVAVGTSMNVTERRQFSEVLQASEKRSSELASMLRLMCDNVPDMIWAKDLEKRFLFANRAFCDQLLNAGDTDEPLGKTDMFFARRERESHPDDPQWHTFGELCQDSDAITLERDAESVFEEFGNIKGRLTYLDVHKAPFRNEQGEVIGTVGSARDITERKLTEAELQRHRRHLEDLVQQRTGELLATEARASRILESAADGLYGVDSESRITFINPAACRMLGYTAEQAMGRSAHELFHHSHPDGRPYPAAECLARQAWRDGCESRVDDETYWHADGHPVPVTLASRPVIENGRIAGAVISVVDVSSQRAAAEARERALVAAENLARARSEFLANMSHEIRTPMNGMLGFAQIGQRNYQNPDKARNAFEKIVASGNQLLGVVNEILDFSKIDAGQLKVEAADMSLTDALERAIELVAERARSKGLDLRLEKAPDFPDACVSDPLRIGQILLNLLSNAVKFTEAGHITLSAARQGDDLVFRVTDTGIGMTEEQLGYVFNPFQQADGSTTRKFGGTGLGLAICKRLLELMHGTIRVESRPGVGSTFEFRLPYVAPGVQVPAAASLPAVLPERPLAGLSILLAEDDEINRLVLEANLEEDGARLAIVGDGREAVERVRQDGAAAYDVVLMDIQMPEMDGYEATRRIRELAPGLPVIGQTAHAFAEERDKCYAAGMVGHIAKPIDPQALVTLILRIASGRREADSPDVVGR